MILIKAYKFRLEPKPTQALDISKALGCARLVYNKALEEKNYLFQEYETSIGYNRLSKSLTVSKRLEEYSFLKEVPAVPLQQTLKNLDNAFQRFFKGVAEYPQRKKKNKR